MHFLLKTFKLITLGCVLGFITTNDCNATNKQIPTRRIDQGGFIALKDDVPENDIQGNDNVSEAEDELPLKIAKNHLAQLQTKQNSILKIISKISVNPERYKDVNCYFHSAISSLQSICKEIDKNKFIDEQFLFPQIVEAYVYLAQVLKRFCKDSQHVQKYASAVCLISETMSLLLKIKNQLSWYLPVNK